MYVVGGLIVGNPDDTRASIDANLTFAREHIDWPYIQHPTPYPGTPMTRDFVERQLIVNDRVEEYDGTTAVVRSEHLSAEEIEFLRWRAERWMKLQPFLARARAQPGLRAASRRRDARPYLPRQLAAIVPRPRDERAAFARYRAIRRVEREYLPDVDTDRDEQGSRIPMIADRVNLRQLTPH